MVDGSLLPPDSTDRAIDPEVLSPNQKRSRFGPSLRRTAWLVSAASLISFAGWLLQNFLQLRGVVNLVLSRIDLAALWIVCFAIACLLTVSVKHNKAVIRVVSGVLLLGAILGLDAWAPKPRSSEALKGLLSREEQEHVDRLHSEALAGKAKFVESATYLELTIARRKLRADMQRLEKKYGCMNENGWPVKCMPNPPKQINQSWFRITAPVSLIAEDLDSTRIWLLHPPFRLPAPIALFLRVTNTSNQSARIDRLTLESTSPDGWQQLRKVGTLEADSLYGNGQIVVQREDSDNGLAIKGMNLISRLYETTIPPLQSVEGWILAEYPPEIKHGDSLGDVRISISANGDWAGSTVIHTHASVGTHGVETDNHQNSVDLEIFAAAQ